MTSRNYVILSHATFDFAMIVFCQEVREEAFHVGDLSLDHERQIIPTGAGIITSMASLLEIAGSPAIT